MTYEPILVNENEEIFPSESQDPQLVDSIGLDNDDVQLTSSEQAGDVRAPATMESGNELDADLQDFFELGTSASQPVECDLGMEVAEIPDEHQESRTVWCMTENSICVPYNCFYIKMH